LARLTLPPLSDATDHLTVPCASVGLPNQRSSLGGSVRCLVSGGCGCLLPCGWGHSHTLHLQGTGACRCVPVLPAVFALLRWYLSGMG
jgi:hypothetical protein